MADGPYIYRIDAEDRLVFVNEQWDKFAEENAGPVSTGNGLIGTSLWDYIADIDTRYLYGELIKRTRATGANIRVPFRCDAPAILREMELIIRPFRDGEVEFRVELLRTEGREPLAILSIEASRTEVIVRMCSMCKAVAVDSDEWVGLEAAVKLLHIFAAPHQPKVTHGMCPSCYEEAMAALKD